MFEDINCRILSLNPGIFSRNFSGIIVAAIPPQRHFLFLPQQYSLHDKKDAQSMLDGVVLLDSIIGSDLFHNEVQILLTDRGSEFTAAEAIETREDSTRRTSIFYCDPLQSCQKGSLENNHIELRYICPSGTDLRNLGLVDQNDLNVVLSHVSSSSKEKLNGKTAH